MRRVRRVTAFGFLLGLALGRIGGEARAANVSVNPVQVHLSAKQGSALLTVKNQGSSPARFQLSASAWAQDENGGMVLEPTRDVVFFPTIVSIAPGEDRKIRIGVTAKAGEVEKTYRLFLDELPSEREEGHSGVRVLTKLGVPIFLQPAKPRGELRLAGTTLKDGMLAVMLENGGNSYVVPRQVRIRAVDGKGKSRVLAEQSGWYVLAGTRRLHKFPLPPDACRAAVRLEVEVEHPGKTLTNSLEVDPAACGR